MASAVWADFAARTWEREAAALPGVLERPLASEAVLLRALVSAAEERRARGAAVQLSFFVDGAEEKGDFTAHLPRSSDASILGYLARVDRALAGAEFTLLLADVHLYDRELWGRARAFLRQLYPAVGIPCGGVDTAVFLGRYRRTPFGVHRGQMSVVTFPVAGTKHFRLWPRGYGEAHPEIHKRVEYPEHIDRSFTLSGRPGDVLYWPADLWHIAEGDGEYTAAWNLGFWWDQPPLARVLGPLGARLHERVGVADSRGLSFALPVTAPRSLEGALPAGLRDAAAAVRASVAAELDAVIATDWLRALSADGFRSVPPPLAPEALPLDDLAALAPLDLGAVQVARDAGGRLHVAAHGHGVVVDDDARVHDLLARLGRGECVALALDEAGDAVADVAVLLLATRAARAVTGAGEGDRDRGGQP